MAYSSCNLAKEILGTDCIGDSRTTINKNFSALEIAICNNTAQVITVTDSPTINMSYVRTSSVTQLLSADIFNDSVTYSKLASWVTLSASPTLSAEAVQPKTAAAWVSFDGTTTTPTMDSTYNTLSVVRNNTGDYTVYFTSALTITNYPVMVTAKTAGVYLYTTSHTKTSFRILSNTFAGIATDAFVSAVVYSY